MEKEPLLTHSSPRKRSSLSSLPEDDEISIPLPLTPVEIKDRLIFGPASSPDEASHLLGSLSHPLASSPSLSPLDPFFPDRGRSTAQLPAMPAFHRCKTAPAIGFTGDLGVPRFSSDPKPQPPSQSIVRHAVIFLAVYLSFGVIVYWFERDSFLASETHPVVDAIYFCIVTMCTIGYGDITPNSLTTKLFSIMFVLVGFGFIDILLSGMVSYVLDLQENHLLQAVKQRGQNSKDTNSGPRSYIIDVKKGRMRIRMKVGLALGVVVICIGIGVGVIHFVERLGWLDSLYCSVMSVTTVGYGDRAFKSLPGRIFASVWLLVSTLAVARAFLYLAEARVDKRQRRMAKWVLEHGMTVAEFLAADIDNNGSVR